jgi:hypothetical protein
MAGVIRPHQSFTFPVHGRWTKGPISQFPDRLLQLPEGTEISLALNENNQSAVSVLIELYLLKSRRMFEDAWKFQDGEMLVIKYLPANRLNGFLASNQLYAAKTPGFTWGDAVYVTPLDIPFSTMMYGCVGIIGKIRPTAIFDGADPFGIMLYQRWIRSQLRWYDLLTTTIHADIANRMLRNKFRTAFKIDCVYFQPDQYAQGYVVRKRDRWLALSHWVPGSPRRVGSGPSSMVIEPEFCVVVSEEFQATESRFVYRPLLGAALRTRNTRAIPVRQGDPAFASTLRKTYTQTRANRDSGLFPEPVYVTCEIP